MSSPLTYFTVVMSRPWISITCANMLRSFFHEASVVTTGETVSKICQVINLWMKEAFYYYIPFLIFHMFQADKQRDRPAHTHKHTHMQHAHTYTKEVIVLLLTLDFCWGLTFWISSSTLPFANFRTSKITGVCWKEGCRLNGWWILILA